LDLLVYPVTQIAETNGSVLAQFHANLTGGELPYSYTAKWSDGVKQTSSDGVFSRLFASSNSIPPEVTVVVTSADGQTAQVEILT
jgi:hypothetical protein